MMDGSSYTKPMGPAEKRLVSKPWYDPERHAFFLESARWEDRMNAAEEPYCEFRKRVFGGKK